MSLINKPLETARRVEIVETVGIASPRACGQAMTKTVIAKVIAKDIGWPKTNHQTTKVERVGRQLGIDTIYSEVAPIDKYKYIKRLQDGGNVVVMAGDGVNDAPALTQANVGVAIGTGTDVAVEAGDVVLTQGSPESLVKLIVLSKKVYKKMVENLVYAAGYNILAIPVAAGVLIPFGFRLTPAIGAFVMSLSSVAVVANALTLLHLDLNVK